MGELVNPRVVKVNGVYEIHIYEFIITTTFNPIEVISITDGIIKGRVGQAFHTSRGKYRISIHKDSLIFEVLSNFKENYHSTFTLKDETLYLEVYDRFTRTNTEHTIEVEYRNNKTKSARNHSV